MVLGFLAKWGSIAGGILLFILFVVRSSQVGIGNATAEIGSGISNIGKGIGETGTGFKTLGEGIGGGITGLFSPLKFFKDLIYGTTGGTTNPTNAANTNNTVTTSTQQFLPQGSNTLSRINALRAQAGSRSVATSIVRSGGTTTTTFSGAIANRASAIKGSINKSIKAGQRAKAGRK